MTQHIHWYKAVLSARNLNIKHTCLLYTVQMSHVRSFSLRFENINKGRYWYQLSIKYVVFKYGDDSDYSDDDSCLLWHAVEVVADLNDFEALRETLLLEASRSETSHIIAWLCASPTSGWVWWSLSPFANVGRAGGHCFVTASDVRIQILFILVWSVHIPLLMLWSFSVFACASQVSMLFEFVILSMQVYQCLLC